MGARVLSRLAGQKTYKNCYNRPMQKKSGIIPYVLISLLCLAALTSLQLYRVSSYQSTVVSWFFGLPPFVYVIVKRKSLPWLWLIGPLSVLIFAIGIETGLRHGPWNQRFTAMETGRDFEPHPYLLWVPKGEAEFAKDAVLNYPPSPDDVFPSNSQPFLFRSGPANIEKDPAVFRVMTMGGSNAWGVSVEKYEDTFTALLEQMAVSEYPEGKFDFIAGGMPSYGLFQNLVLYKVYRRKLRPDLVILYANVNDGGSGLGPYTYRELFTQATGTDLSRLWIDDHEFPKGTSLLTRVQGNFRKLHLYNALVVSIKELREKASPEGLNSALVKKVNPISDYEQNLRDLIQMVRKDGGRILLADAYDYHETKPPSEARVNVIRQIMKKVAEEMSVAYVPVHYIFNETYKPAQVVFDHDKHINEFGHYKVAEQIFAEIMNKKLLEPGRKE